ncbi:MAG: hypothetical protein ACJATI_005198 [Halioglobus sp.]|jgi:hypothetical protein
MNPSIEQYRLGLFKCSEKIKSDYSNLNFDWAGLMPTFIDEDKYWCTPVNTKMIGRTGGDGVHYSVLEIDDKINPVVMTIPANFGNETRDFNIILSESISEFLGIGSIEGWFPLEQIVYQGDKFIENYGIKELIEITPESSDGYFVKMLTEYFSVTNVKLERSRLMELENIYFDKLEFTDEFIDVKFHHVVS